MTRRVVAILFGGASPEYAVSLKSAYAVVSHLDKERFIPVLVGITQEGHWFHYRGDTEALLNDTWCTSEHCTPAFISPCRNNAGLTEYSGGIKQLTALDAAFPVMHGTFGEDGTIQGLLELAGIPLVGCGTLSSALCMHKNLTHRLVNTIGIETPLSKLITRNEPLEVVEHFAAKLGWPVFIKPARSGSSLGISLVSTVCELHTALEEAFTYGDEVIVEQAIKGIEVGAAVMGRETLVLGEPDEIELTQGFFDYTEKYSLVTSKIHTPARISAENAERIKRNAVLIYQLLGCSGFARVDQFLTPSGRIVFNEVNTIPGFTEHSRFPLMMKAAGREFSEVVNELVESALVS